LLAVVEEIRQTAIETSTSLPSLVRKRHVYLRSKSQAKSFHSMDESNDVTNTAPLIIFIPGCDGGSRFHDEVGSSCIFKGPAVCVRSVHESKACSLELGKDTLTSVTCELVLLRRAMRMSSRNPIIFDSIIHQYLCC
jgi:hypothetical protein